MAKPIADLNAEQLESIQKSITQIISDVGEDPTREGMASTPKRYAKALSHFTSGYRTSLTDAVGEGVFEEDSSDLVVVKDIELYSLCEHHLVPFHGRAHVAYIPNGKIVGLSKIPRIVDMYARRFQVQERLGNQIAHAIEEVLNPLGVAVIIEAYHLCVMMRGVGKQNSKTVTSSIHGLFREDPRTRSEFLTLIGGLSL